MNEAPCKIGGYFPDGKAWTVRLNRDDYFDCETQYEAEVLSRLVLLEKKIKK